MTKVVFYPLLLILICKCAFGQTNNQYNEKLHSAIAGLNAAKTSADFEVCSNAFSRIANVERKEWLPLYYSAYSKVKSAYLIKDKIRKGSKADEAEALIEKCEQLSKNNSEIYCIKGMIANLRITIDPMANGMKYGIIMNDFYATAIKLNPKNARAYFLTGAALFYTPAQWGGGKDKAKPYFDKAKLYFENKVDIPLPQWGKEENDYFLTACK